MRFLKKIPHVVLGFLGIPTPGVTNGKVEIIGVNPVTATCTQYSGFTRNEAVVTGLSPNTTYSFKVGGA